jgi:pimeloyl-ACP methyl ester carboxylesterase
MPSPEASVVLAPGPWTHRDIAANGARFHAAEIGSGPLVLLLHGFPEFWWAWRHQLPLLAQAGYRGVAVDLRGYGGSDKPPRGYDPFTLSADVTALIRALGEREAVVVGHGWGGFLGWTTAVLHPQVVSHLAVLSMPHPRRLRAALIADQRQMAHSVHVLGFQTPWVPERRLVADDGALVERLIRRWSATPDWPDQATTACYRQAIRIPGVAHSALEYHRWALRSIPRPDGMRFARRMRTPVRVPVLHIHGERDGSLLPRSAAGSNRYVSGPYRWRLLRGVGHFPHEECPEALGEELLSWLRSHPRDDS